MRLRLLGLLLGVIKKGRRGAGGEGGLKAPAQRRASAGAR
ncbi:hypothetical protein [Klebsiella pneumoniae IS43]|uniref:Uncharacterized protein n=1 Tax=Klebsiella pneumoniae IS43 TaxID=1432552 RepID=W1DJ44_KLEPN|nr:hypothetical protein [Klebsiella pneumoniae IS43]